MCRGERWIDFAGVIADRLRPCAATLQQAPPQEFKEGDRVCIVADAAARAKKICVAAVFYNSQSDQAAFGDMQWVLPRKTVLDVDLLDEVAELEAKGRLERVATFRYLCALLELTSLAPGAS